MACEYCSWEDKPVPIFYYGLDWPVVYIENGLLVIDKYKELLFAQTRSFNPSNQLLFNV